MSLDRRRKPLWYRTYLGWVDGDHVQVMEVPSDGVLDCLTDGFGVVRAEP